MAKQSKTNLEKSHSKVSNFKLTLICLLASFGVAMLFFGLGSLTMFQTISIVIIVIGTIFTVLGLLLINKFTR